MDTLFKLSIGLFLTCASITALDIRPAGAVAVQATGDQLQKPEKSTPGVQPAQKYGSRLSERNTAARKQSKGITQSGPRQAGTIKNRNSTAKRQLSRRNQAVVDQAEAAQQKRELVDRLNADSPQQ